jgi:hypothetical protein
MDVRFVAVKGVKYLRAEDVAEYLREVAATEPTDTRERLETAADNLTEPPQAV